MKNGIVFGKIIKILLMIGVALVISAGAYAELCPICWTEPGVVAHIVYPAVPYSTFPNQTAHNIFNLDCGTTTEINQYNWSCTCGGIQYQTGDGGEDVFETREYFFEANTGTTAVSTMLSAVVGGATHEATVYIMPKTVQARWTEEYSAEHVEGGSSFVVEGSVIDQAGFVFPAAATVYMELPNGHVDTTSLFNGDRTKTVESAYDSGSNTNKFTLHYKTGASSSGTNVVYFSTSTPMSTIAVNVAQEIGASQEEQFPHAYANNLIDTFNGKVSFSVTDIQVPGPGPSLNFTRSYSTRPKNAPGATGNILFDSGRHWTCNYDMRLFANETKAQLIKATGSTHYYYDGYVENRMVTGEYVPQRIHDYFLRPDGEFGLLRNCGTYYELEEKDGSILKFENYDLSQYRLKTITDKNGNKLTITYDDVSGLLSEVCDDLGRKLVYTRVSQSAILDNVSLVVGGVTKKTYKFEYENGDLISVKGPETTTPYAYTASYSYGSYVYYGTVGDRFMTSYSDPHMPKGITTRMFEYENSDTSSASHDEKQ